MCDQTKTVHFLDNKKLKDKKLDDKDTKNAKIRKEGECFQNQNIHIEITKNRNTEKPTSIIVYKIRVFYFKI